MRIKRFSKSRMGYKKRLANVQVDLSFGNDEFGKEIAKLNALLFSSTVITEKIVTLAYMPL